jgi:hypothetical protein
MALSLVGILVLGFSVWAYDDERSGGFQPLAHTRERGSGGLLTLGYFLGLVRSAEPLM